MNKLYTYTNDVLDSLISGYKSPQSIAKAYRQYLADKAVITSKVISAVASAVAQSGEETTDRMDVIGQIIDEAGLLPGTPVFTHEGDVVRLDDFISAVKNGEEDLTSTVTGIFGKASEVGPTIDALVDSFQVNKIAESAFATLEVVGDTAKSSISDMATRVNALGMELSTGASNMMATVGDIMGDTTTGIVSKISVISTLLGFNVDKVLDSDENGIQIPDFADDDMNGTSPILSVLQSINIPSIDLTTPVSAVVSAVKGVTNVFKGLFNKGKNLVNKGWNIAKTYVNETFVDPIDFVILNENSVSGMLDIPFFDASVTADEISQMLTEFGASLVSAENVLKVISDLKTGQMRSVYTPFSVLNIIKEDIGVRIIGHIIPSKPMVVKSAGIENWRGYFDVPTVYLEGDQVIDNGTKQVVRGNAEKVYDNFVASDVSNDFQHSGDDDPYYYAAVAASLFRNANLMINATFNLNYDTKLKVPNNGYVDQFTPNELAVYLANGPSGATVPLSYAKVSGWRITTPGNTGHGVYHPLPYNQFGENFTLQLIEAALKKLPSEEVTNKKFSDFLGEYKDKSQQWKVSFATRVLIMAATNSFDFMDSYFNYQGDVPSFLPSIVENEYQTPMYGIVTDSKHGEKIAKLFKGVAIVAAVVVAGVVAAKVVRSVKRTMKIEGIRLEALRRQAMDLDPNDSSYKSDMLWYLKTQKKYDKKNKFLSMVGMGYTNTATSIMNSGFDLPFLFSNKDVLDVIG